LQEDSDNDGIGDACDPTPTGDADSDHIEDVDGDGDLDMVLHFATQSSGIACGDTSVVLTGKTFAGTDIIGADSLVIAGCK
jgi:hypothetical protein